MHLSYQSFIKNSELPGNRKCVLVSSPQRSNSYHGLCGDTDEHLLTALLRPGPPVGAQSQWTHLCDVTCRATAEGSHKAILTRVSFKHGDNQLKGQEEPNVGGWAGSSNAYSFKPE